MASRKEQKEQRRQERLAAEQAASDKQKRQRMYGMVIGGILVVAAIVAVIAVAGSGGSDKKSEQDQANYGPTAKFDGAVAPPAKKEADYFKAAAAAGCDRKDPPIEGSTHVDSKKPVKYKTNPPTSGNHDEAPQPDGVYTKFPQPRHLVHALEGGRVQIQYNPKKVSKKQIAQLGGLYNADNLYMLLFPNPTMPYAVAVTSWGHLAGCKQVSAKTFDVIAAFIERYRDQTQEPGATHQPAINGEGWPDGGFGIPPAHKQGAIPGS